MIKKKSVLIYFTWQLKSPHHGIIIQELDKILKRDDVGKIYYITCGGVLKPCYTNSEGDIAICNLCKFYKNTALDNYRDEVQHIELDDELLKTKNYSDSYTYSNVEDIKKIKYKDGYIGYGALSSYISFTRNLEPAMDNDFRMYFDTLLTNQKALVDFFDEFIDSKDIKELYFFNGRTADVRPLYDIAKAKAIEFYSLELIPSSKNGYHINKFKQSLPHDIEFHHHRMIECWEDESVGYTEKLEIGSSFFENRRKGVLTRDIKVYTDDQIWGELPENWDGKKNNIVIFNSSEDEFASIGDMFESKCLFPSQEIGLSFIFEEFKNDENIHFYLRVHPNLSTVHYNYHKRIYNFEKKYRNVTVISSSSTISTYSLIDNAKKVIVFGSSTGAEACYSGKPVILLGGSFYYYLDITHIPENTESLLHLITNNINPKPKLEAIKYGYYLMNYKIYTSVNSQDPKPLRFLGINLGVGWDFLKINDSMIIFKIKERLYKGIIRFIGNKLYSLPIKGK